METLPTTIDKGRNAMNSIEQHPDEQLREDLEYTVLMIVDDKPKKLETVKGADGVEEFINQQCAKGQETDLVPCKREVIRCRKREDSPREGDSMVWTITPLFTLADVEFRVATAEDYADREQ